VTKEEKYIASIREIEIRLERGGDLIADLGNVAAVLKKRMGFFWVGFYFYRENHLVLGPFQGTPACVFLAIAKGVCGTCAQKKETILVPDVHRFPGHVACDPNSKSEIVIPLFDASGSLRGVLDADSDVLDAFDDVDKIYLEKIGKLIEPCWDEEQ
jgi:L-methionine (R)-S-oxide reductase